MKAAARFASTVLCAVTETVNERLPPRLRRRTLSRLTGASVCLPFGPRDAGLLTQQCGRFQIESSKSGPNMGVASGSRKMQRARRTFLKWANFGVFEDAQQLSN